MYAVGFRAISSFISQHLVLLFSRDWRLFFFLRGRKYVVRFVPKSSFFPFREITLRPFYCALYSCRNESSLKTPRQTALSVRNYIMRSVAQQRCHMIK
jgi:hypothetical protein